MRHTEKTKTIVIVILAIVAGMLLFGNILTNAGVGTTLTNSSDPEKYEYGVPLQHVVDLHYMEIGEGLITEDAYPVFETNDAGWIVYTIGSKSTDIRLKDMVFYGPEFWDMIRNGTMSDTTNWQE